MRRSINILSVVRAFQKLDDDDFKKFQKYFEISAQNSEVEDLSGLIECLALGKKLRSNHFEGFCLGYKIPQISKEFDLLRFGSNYNLNVELKRDADEEKIHKQLIRNRYYLEHLGNETKFFCFVASSKCVFGLDENQKLVCKPLDELADAIFEQKVDRIDGVDQLFDPTRYLVSPFNEHEKFLNSEYFLTSQQEEFESRMCSAIDNRNSHVFISLFGSAGTGKTLLSYHLVKKYLSNGNRVLIIHCANLNEGQVALIQKNWTIMPVKSLDRVNFSNYGLILIDEAQRLKKEQLNKIIAAVKKNQIACIFSHDEKQSLTKGEATFERCTEIADLSGSNSFKLSDKIRTNKEIANFIKSLFDNSRTAKDCCSPNIQIRFFDDARETKALLFDLALSSWKVLGLTSSRYTQESLETYKTSIQMDSHEVIGQEFDKVALVIDANFDYDPIGKLYYKQNTYYPPVDMLFQNLTRTRKELMIIILNNKKILNRCLAILSY